jgi:hypothetical protein
MQILDESTMKEVAANTLADKLSHSKIKILVLIGRVMTVVLALLGIYSIIQYLRCRGETWAIFFFIISSVALSIVTILSQFSLTLLSSFTYKSFIAYFTGDLIHFAQAIVFIVLRATDFKFLASIIASGVFKLCTMAYVERTFFREEKDVIDPTKREAKRIMHLEVFVGWAMIATSIGSAVYIGVNWDQDQTFFTTWNLVGIMNYTYNSSTIVTRFELVNKNELDLIPDRRSTCTRFLNIRITSIGLIATTEVNDFDDLRNNCGPSIINTVRIHNYTRTTCTPSDIVIERGINCSLSYDHYYLDLANGGYFPILNYTTSCY